MRQVYTPKLNGRTAPLPSTPTDTLACKLNRVRVFNKELAEKTVKGLQQAVKDCNQTQETLTHSATQLHQLRAETRLVVIEKVDDMAFLA